MNWDLSKLYNGFDDPAFEVDIETTRRLIEESMDSIASAQHGENDGENDGETIAEAFSALSEILNLFIRVYGMVSLTLAADANDETARGYRDRLMELEVSFTQLQSRITAFVGTADEAQYSAKHIAVLDEHTYMLELMRHEYAHLIDPALENVVLKLRMTGGHAWSQLRDTLDANHMIDVTVDGEAKTLPLSAVRGLAYSADAKTRKAAYEAELASYARIENSVAACLNGIKGEALTVTQLRHYDSVLDHMLDIARIDRQTLDALLDSMKRSLPNFRRYFRAKGKLLGHADGLPFYDLFAPLGNAVRQYTFEEAKDELLGVFEPFSPRMAGMIRRAFDERWIDAYPREGKVGGAFCMSMHPLGTSYVLTNFEGSLSSVVTLAHELGHAYHNECTKHLSIFKADYPMPLAETASIFNETFLMNARLETVEGDEALQLLDQQLIEASQVVVDILSRYMFETEVFARRATRSLSPRELNEIMLDAQRQTYGDGLDSQVLHPYMWLCKSHYYSPDLHFYNFPYAFGLLFGLGVFAQYKKQGNDFSEAYDKLLAATGSHSVADVAASIGIDVRSTEFWDQSLAVIAGWIDRIVSLCENHNEIIVDLI